MSTVVQLSNYKAINDIMMPVPQHIVNQTVLTAVQLQ